MKGAKPPPTRERNALGRLQVFLSDHAGDLGYALCTLVLTVAGLSLATRTFSGYGRWAAIMSIAAVAITAFVCQVVKARKEDSNSELRNRISDLEGRNDELEENLGNLSAQYQTFFRDLLSTLARQDLGYGMTERISVYRHDSNTRSFRLVARYSDNPQFDGFGQRTSYPDNEGVIGEAWSKGFCAPEPLPNADHDLTDYYEQTERRFRIKREVVKNFRMPSCCYAAFALPHPFGGGRENVAVVVFESRELGKLRTKQLKQEILGPGGPGNPLGSEGERIARFLISTEAIETRSDIASEEGV